MVNSPDLLDAPIETVALTFVDVETTGLGPRDGDRVCEVAAVRYRGDREVERFVTLVNPLRRISPGAWAVNRIDEVLLRVAPTFDQVAPALHRFLAGSSLVAHNAPFDLAFLAHEFARAGFSPPETVVLDTLLLARRCFSFRSNSLSAIAAELGIPGGAHRALADVQTTRAVLRRFVDLLGASGPRCLGDLVALQGGAVPWPRIAAGESVPLPPDLAEALTTGRRLRLRYVSGQGQPTDRLVDPIQLVAKNGEQYLLAYCHLRQEQRTFRLDRIVGWELA